MNVTAALSQDVAVVGHVSPCSREGQLSDGWSCFRARGDQYHGSPTNSRLPTSLAAGNTRLLLGVELPFGPIAIGARVGWAFRGVAPPSDGQDRALPFGFELTGRARLAKRRGVQLDALLIGGVRVLDAYAKLHVIEDSRQPVSAYQLDNPERQTLDGYRRMGTGFIGVGLAASFAVAKWSALRVELPFSYFFPTTGFAISPNLTWVVTL
jgi:hypothetical protein